MSPPDANTDTSTDTHTDGAAARHARALWRYTGDDQPPFAITPRVGEESVWSYPRPPRIAPDAREVVVRAGTVGVARTRSALRVLETASPPTFYLPRADVNCALLQPAPGTSVCEWKGAAQYLSVVVAGQRFERVAWFYADPLPAFAALRGRIGFYPSPLACFVDSVRVLPQPGRFYAGWVTPDVVGPFKGSPGSEGW